MYSDTYNGHPLWYVALASEKSYLSLHLMPVYGDSTLSKELSDGFKTEIGDHGVRLSGGQRQRIALARALIKDPPVLILDEATSMYDPEGEHAFIQACASALKGRTVILISHRPASLSLADRIFQIDAGNAREVKDEPHQRAANNV